jgi:hypothetical protein
MNKDMLKRLARLEAKLGMSDAITVNTNWAV